jgi:hypothetical protein
LIRASLVDIPEPDHVAIGLARVSALASIRLDALSSQVISGSEDVDDLKLVRLAGVVARSQAALAAMKAKAQAQPPGAPPGPSALWRHLAEMAKRKAAKRPAKASGAPGAEPPER